MKKNIFDFSLNKISPNTTIIAEGEAVFLRIKNDTRDYLLEQITSKETTLISIMTNYCSLSYFLSSPTVYNYLLKNSNLDKEKVKEIINKTNIPNPNMKMEALYGGLGKKMALNIWITFSKINFIIIDLRGMTPMDMYYNSSYALDNISDYQGAKSVILIDTIDNHLEEELILLDNIVLKNIFEIK